MLAYRYNVPKLTLEPKRPVRRATPRSPGRPPSAKRSDNVHDCLACGARYFSTKAGNKTCSRDCAAQLKGKSHVR
jgi:hypothetical protein